VAGKPEKRKKEKRATEKTGLRFDEMKKLGNTLVHRPKDFPATTRKVGRRIVHSLWNAHGGGLYTCGFIITWLYLEARMLIDDIVDFSIDMQFDSLLQWLIEIAVAYLVRFLTESLANTVQAFLWPLHFITLYPPFGVIALAILFAVFPRYIKPALERRMFGEN
jgi:hypothetical protein